MMWPPRRSTQTDTLCPDATLFRSVSGGDDRVAAFVEPGIAARAGGQQAGLDPLTATGGVHLVEDRPQRVLGHAGNERRPHRTDRSDEHTSELKSLMRISYAVFCVQKKIITETTQTTDQHRKH